MPLITDMSLVAIARRCPNLRILVLGEMDRVTDASLCEIAARSSWLQALTICHCENVTDLSVTRILRNCTLLESLDLGLVGDITLLSLVVAAKYSLNLREIVLSGNLHADLVDDSEGGSCSATAVGVSTGAVVEVLRQVRGPLDSVTIFQSKDMTREHVERLAEACPGLRKVFIRSCSGISQGFAREFSRTHKLQLVVT
ncbi:hypothetical protein HK102_008035 [Quaeritorhiza haematococci]|nr:hypothetical protein HK102_008035 [Quaeritorhiza haematococci]